VGLLTDRINSKFEKCKLINEHVLNHEPVPLKYQRAEICHKNIPASVQEYLTLQGCGWPTWLFVHDS